LPPPRARRRDALYSLTTLNWLRFPEGSGEDEVVSPLWPLERVVDAVAEAGSPGIGLDGWTIAQHVQAGGSVEDGAALLQSRGLVCTDVAPLLVAEPETRAEAERFAHLAAATGSRICVAAVYSPKPRDHVIRDLRLCAAVLSESGTRLALEFTSFGGLLTLADAIELSAEVGWERCGVLVDSLHFFRTGAPWQELQALDPDQVALVHLDDARRDAVDRVRESRFGRLLPGAGELPLDDFHRALVALGYRGVVSAEVLSAQLRTRPPEEAARELLDAMRNVWPA
jgi:sugar phosphate isomerase/epimerase